MSGRTVFVVLIVHLVSVSLFRKPPDVPLPTENPYLRPMSKPTHQEDNDGFREYSVEKLKYAS